MVLRVIRALILGAAVLGVLATPGRARAHELLVDQLVLFPRFEEAKLRAELSFDPEYTRRLDDPAAAAELEARVRGFVEREVSIAVDGARCRPRLELRELYVRGGAAPGDIVMLDCLLAKGARELVVAIGTGFAAPLLVSVELDGARKSVLVAGGETAPAFRFGTSDDPSWRPGRPEDFVADGGPTPRTAPPTAPGSVGRDPAGGPMADRAGGEFAAESTFRTLARYVALGFRHIVPDGWDHVLFVASIVLGSGRRVRRLLLELSLFTAAHTLTLGLGALGWIVLPARLVEPLIAFSIALVAVENLLQRNETRHRMPLVFVFGLLHGQGFAGSLAATGLPEGTFLTALFSFNVGVELGQLAVVLVMLAALRLLRDPEAALNYLIRPASLAIAAVGSFWGIERLFG